MKRQREKRLSYSNQYKSRRYPLESIQRPSCVSSGRRAFAKRARNVNLRMTCQWRGKQRRETCMQMLEGLKRNKVRTIWRTGTKRNCDKSFSASTVIPKRLQMLYASSSSTLWRIRNMAGSGLVRMVEINANIDTVYHRGMFIRNVPSGIY